MSPADALVLAHPPVDKASLRRAAGRPLGIVDAPRPPARTRQFLKATESYARAWPRAAFPSTCRMRRHACALHEASGDQQQGRQAGHAQPEPAVGKRCPVLRQPVLAEALGLMGEAAPRSTRTDRRRLDLRRSARHQRGAGVVDLARRRRRAAAAARSARTAQGAVQSSAVPGRWRAITDEVFREAELYEDGLAKVSRGAARRPRCRSVGAQNAATASSSRGMTNRWRSG